MDASENETTAEMKRHGIVTKSVAYYDFGGYRYTSLKDAIAAGKRSQAPGGHDLLPSSS